MALFIWRRKLPQFKPGQSGNPKGRPRTGRQSLREVLQRKMDRLTTKNAFSAMLIDTAIKSKSESARLQAAKLILEYLEGKPGPRPAAKQDNTIRVEYGGESANDPNS
jgi:hypothetical protein